MVFRGCIYIFFVLNNSFVWLDACPFSYVFELACCVVVSSVWSLSLNSAAFTRSIRLFAPVFSLYLFYMICFSFNTTTLVTISIYLFMFFVLSFNSIFLEGIFWAL